MRMVLMLAPVALVACLPSADAYRALLPDDRLIIDEMGGEELLRGIGETSEHYQLTRDITRDVNGGVGEVLAMVDHIASFPPSWSDGEEGLALWGPWLDDGVHGQMWMQRNADDSHTWAIELRPEGSAEDAWVPAVAGEIEPDATELNSTGRFAMDLTAIAEHGGDPVTGQLVVEYELVENGADMTVFFGDISEDGSIPVDAGYRFEHEKGAGGLMDVIVEEDVSDPANGTLETMIIRSRWDETGAGRSDALVTGGDLGALTFTETECWSAAHTAVYMQNNYELREEGDAEACAFAEASFNE